MLKSGTCAGRCKWCAPTKLGHKRKRSEFCSIYISHVVFVFKNRIQFTNEGEGPSGELLFVCRDEILVKEDLKVNAADEIEFLLHWWTEIKR